MCNFSSVTNSSSEKFLTNLPSSSFVSFSLENTTNGQVENWWANPVVRTKVRERMNDRLPPFLPLYFRFNLENDSLGCPALQKNLLLDRSNRGKSTLRHSRLIFFSVNRAGVDWIILLLPRKQVSSNGFSKSIEHDAGILLTTNANSCNFKMLSTWYQQRSHFLLPQTKSYALVLTIL